VDKVMVAVDMATSGKKKGGSLVFASIGNYMINK
jgi:hypothetical protein